MINNHMFEQRQYYVSVQIEVNLYSTLTLWLRTTELQQIIQYKINLKFRIHKLYKYVDFRNEGKRVQVKKVTFKISDLYFKKENNVFTLEIKVFI